ncbi:MAG: four helix bundle protein [Verrucomicrobiae bacterium]
MAFAERFEDLKVWQESRALVKGIYQSMNKTRDYSFRDQIQRATLSVMNNIAEGFERKTRKDFAHFLDLAKGSAGEVRSMLYAAQDLRYIEPNQADAFRLRFEQLATSIGSLASRLRKADANK